MPLIPPSIAISLQQLRQQLNLVYQDVRIQNNNSVRIERTVTNVNRTVTNIQDFDDRLLRQLMERCLDSVRNNGALIRATRGQLERQNQALRATLDSVLQELENTTTFLEGAIEESATRIEGAVTSSQTAVVEAVATATSTTEATLGSLRIVLVGALTTLEAELLASKEVTLATRLAILAAIAGVASETSAILALVGNVEASVLVNRATTREESQRLGRGVKSYMDGRHNRIVRELTQEVRQGTDKVSKKIDDLARKVARFQKEVGDTLKKLPDEVAQEVSMQVVGESYYRWDSTTTYFPTLTFVFREVEVGQYPRKAQIKVRLKKMNKEVTQADIDLLRARCRGLCGLSYTYGTVRANYVSHDKRFKTTIFSNSAETATQVLEPICQTIEEPFEKKNLSLTYDRTRLNSTRRTATLDGIRTNTVDYKTDIKLRLFRVVLLVNGLASPLVVFHSKPSNTNQL